MGGYDMGQYNLLYASPLPSLIFAIKRLDAATLFCCYSQHKIAIVCHVYVKYDVGFTGFGKSGSDVTKLESN